MISLILSHLLIFFIGYVCAMVMLAMDSIPDHCPCCDGVGTVRQGPCPYCRIGDFAKWRSK